MRIRFTVLAAAFLVTAPAWGSSLTTVLTPPQQALLGCGPFYGTDCDVAGIGLVNNEASALIHSLPAVVGQPGTIPGARGGTATGGPSASLSDFRSEMAALSWSLTAQLVAVSQSLNPGAVDLDELGIGLPFRPDGCSFVNPSSCVNVPGLYQPAAAVPEPGASLLFAGGLVLAAAKLRRVRQA